MLASVHGCGRSGSLRRWREIRLVFLVIFLSLRRMPFWLIIVLLGIVEGITEFLPISSTGHLLIAENWLHLNAESRFQALNQGQLFNIVIQAGAVLAILPLFPERLRQFVLRWREPETRDYLLKILLPVGMTGAVGYLLEKHHFSLPERLAPVAVALFIGGVLFLVLERWLTGRRMGERITWLTAFAVGVAQLTAGIFPGTSRSGATILVALVLGLSRPAAVEYTFLVGIPTMLGVSGWKIFKALHEPHNGAGPMEWGMVVLGFAVSAVVSFLAVKWLLGYVRTHTFVAFGWYRIALALFIAGLLLWT
jgi:undecaprenyl-diphosphatase